MVNYEETRVKPINTQLKKFKFVAKNKAATTLRIKNFQDEELLH